MFRATVAQKPTIPVKDGMKNFKNGAVEWNLLGVLSTGPRPPAWLVTHHSNSKPTPSMKGAAIPSRNLIASIPPQMTKIFRAQNAKKHAKAAPSDALNDHKCVTTIVWEPLNDHNIDN